MQRDDERAWYFPRYANTVARAAVACAVIFIALLGWASYAVVKSPYFSKQGVTRNQIVPFSHKHHVSGLGIDCRYCHTTAETSYFAGLPPTETCMHCHSQMWSNNPMLEPVRASFQRGEP